VVALTPEEQDEILGLRAELEKALAIWNSSDRGEADFDRLVPFADRFADVVQEVLDRHANARRAVLFKAVGIMLTAVAIAVSIFVPTIGWPPWWFAVSFVVLVAGLSLFVVGGKHGRIT
jgi:CHASE3 domain sensor protein